MYNPMVTLISTFYWDQVKVMPKMRYIKAQNFLLKTCLPVHFCLRIANILFYIILLEIPKTHPKKWHQYYRLFNPWHRHNKIIALKFVTQVGVICRITFIQVFLKINVVMVLIALLPCFAFYGNLFLKPGIMKFGVILRSGIGIA